MNPPNYNQMSSGNPGYFNPVGTAGIYYPTPSNWNAPTYTRQVPYPEQTYQQPQGYSPQNPPARVVNGEEEIRPNEVPSDGSPALFPLADWSRIFVKRVANNGMIVPATYVLETITPENQNQSNDDILSTIMNRLDNIEKMIKKNRYYKSPDKKGGASS